MPPADWLTEAAEDAVRIREVKADLATSLESETNVKASTREHAKDLHVSGPLSEIWEWAQQWRSEIEELG